MARLDRATRRGTLPLRVARSSRAMTFDENAMRQPPAYPYADVVGPGHRDQGTGHHFWPLESQRNGPDGIRAAVTGP